MVNKLLIVKNSAFLYLRMLLSLLVSLYTSRVVLEALGVTDFGVYNVVGGIIGFMGFFNASLSGAISRFITFELGHDDLARQRETFSSAFIITLLLAVVIIFVAETFGLWFLNYKLSIPLKSIWAANWVYQLTIIGMIVSITQSPYTASVIAHERMNVYAYVELLVVGLRLLMVYLLLIINSNHLIWYAVMVTAINCLMALTYRIYCFKCFKECRIQRIWNPQIVKPILKFSGWDVFGNFCITTRVQGLTVLINMFFGVALNAANGIATQVNNNILSFSTNIITAYRPQIIKSYASRSFDDFSVLISDGAKFALIAILMMVIPLCIEIDYVLDLWLKTPPEMTNILCQIILIASVVGTANYTLTIGIQATGNVKYLSLYGGLMQLFIIGGSYCALKLGGEPQCVYIVTIIFNVFILLLDVVILKKQVLKFNYLQFLITIMKVLLISIVAGIAGSILKSILEEGFIRLLLVSLLSGGILFLMTYFVLLSKQQRSHLLCIMKGKIHKILYRRK